jgi:hypothetical protein
MDVGASFEGYSALFSSCPRRSCTSAVAWFLLAPGTSRHWKASDKACVTQLLVAGSASYELNKCGSMRQCRVDVGASFEGYSALFSSCPRRSCTSAVALFLLAPGTSRHWKASDKACVTQLLVAGSASYELNKCGSMRQCRVDVGASFEGYSALFSSCPRRSCT